MSLNEYTTEELKKEIAKREQEVPMQNENIDWNPILRKLHNFMLHVKREKNDLYNGMDGFEYEIFELLIYHVYGNKGKKFLNSMLVD